MMHAVVEASAGFGRSGVEMVQTAPTQSVWGRILKWAPLVLGVLALIGVAGVTRARGGCRWAHKLEVVKPIKFVGHADDAAYALMGQGISEGRGISVPYVTVFYIPYPRSIDHREDHWPPFMGMSIAPVFYFAGKSAFHARVPAVFYGSIGLPLATALLTFALTRRGYAAVLAGLLILANGALYDQSMRVLADISTAMLVAFFCGTLILARRWPWMHLLAGTAAALAYFSKGSELLLIAGYPVFAFLCCGWGAFRRPWVYGGILMALLIAGPFWYGNWRDYGSPFHSTQNYVSGFFGMGEDWESKHYFPYWGQDLPKVSDRWTKYGDMYWRTSRGQLADSMQMTLTGARDSGGDVWTDYGVWGLRVRDWVLGARSRWTNWFGAGNTAPRRLPAMKPVKEWSSPLWELAGMGSALLLAALVATFPVVVGIWLWKWIRRRRVPRVAEGTEMARVAPRNGWLIGPVLTVSVVLAMHLVFLSFFWETMPRLVFPALPLVLALGLTAANCVIEWPLRAIRWSTDTLLEMFWRARVAWPGWFVTTRRALGLVPAVITCVFAVYLLGNMGTVQAMQEDALEHRGDSDNYPGPVDDRFVFAGEWIGKNLPNAVVMCRNPWELAFSMGPGNKGGCLPHPDDEVEKGAQEIFAIARYYHVTHLMVDEMRPALAPYYLKRKPGLTRVPGCPIPLFAIDWSKIPDMSVEEALGRK